MKYKNPILVHDFSDPDAIRVGEDFYMIASSFNYTPGIPILHSKNLVDWEIINYVYDTLPSRYDEVMHGCGAWAPALRYHDGWFYAIIPFPDEGIYVSKTRNPKGKWSDLWCLIPGKGIEDPCPIWVEDKAYLVVGFVKSRIGFNSCLAIYEVSPDLKKQISPTYQIIYDGHDMNPTIEGPKFNQRNGYYYIMAPAGSVKSGWQTCLRSKSIYGPYEAKIVLMQNDSPINGPHQGALLDIDDFDNWAFIHFTDQDCYGRITCLQPVEWHNDWPICGSCKDPLLGGTPVVENDYILDIPSSYKLKMSDTFNKKLNLHWQTPANKKDNWYYVDKGLYLNGLSYNGPIHLMPNTFSQKINYFNFNAKTRVSKVNSQVGLVCLGMEYAYICLEDGFVKIKQGSFESLEETTIYEIPYQPKEIEFSIVFRKPGNYYFKFNKTNLKQYTFKAKKGRWVGSRIGLFSKNGEYSKFDYFKVKEVKNG